MLTLNEIQKLLSDFATDHDQIASSGTGNAAELNPNEREYPLMWISYLESSSDDGIKSDTFRIGILDRVNAGEEGDDDQHHEIEVLSDTQLIAFDLLHYFVQGHQTEYYSAKASNLLPATEQFNDRIAGHFLDLTISQNWDFSKCHIPATFGSPASSVDNLTLYDFCDSSVISRLTSAQRTCLEAEFAGSCDPVTVNVNGVESGTPASGSTYSMDVHSNDGDDVGSVSGSVITVDDSRVRINSTTVGTVDAEDTFNISCEYEDAGGAVGSLVGGVWTIPAATTCGTLAVNLSDANPSLNDTITITATPTDITPTSYTYYTPNPDGSYTQTTQASNTLSWQVTITGTWKVVVVATDGTNFACDDADGETAGDADALAFISAHNTQTGSSMGATQQAAINGLVERLKGTGTTNGSDLWTLLTGDGAVLFPLCPVDDSTANANAYKIDLLDPTNFGIYNNFVAGDFTPNGVTGGSTKYFQSTVSPDDYGQNDVGAHFYCRSNTVGNTQVDVGSTLSGFSVYTKYGSTSSIIRINESGFPGFTTTGSILGLMSYVRTDAADVDWYIDGALEQTETSSSDAPDTGEICFHAIGTAASNPSSRSLSLYAITAGMTANQVQDFGEAVEWYQTNIITGGRNV